MDLRERVIAACDAKDGTHAEIAARFGVSAWWVWKLVRQRRQTGSINPQPHGGGHPSAFDEAALCRLRRFVDDHPDTTLAELRAACGIACSDMAVSRALRKLGYTRKKRRCVRASKTVRT